MKRVLVIFCVRSLGVIALSGFILCAQVTLCTRLCAATYTVSNVTDLQNTTVTASSGSTIVLRSNSNGGSWTNVGAVNLVPSSSNILIQAELPGQVIFSGQTAFSIGTVTQSVSLLTLSGLRFDSATNSGQIISLYNTFDSRITECAFINSGNPSTASGNGGTTAGTSSNIISIRDGSQRLRIDHNFFKSSLSQSISFLVNSTPSGSTGASAGSWHWVDHNYFKDIEPFAGNGQEPIQIGQGNNPNAEMDVMVEWNLWDNAFGDPEFVSSKTNNNFIRYNTFKNALLNLNGLSLREASNAVVDGNFFYSTATGIVAFGENHVIVNNYFQDTTDGYGSKSYGGINLPAGSGELVSALQEPSFHSLIAHNTVVNSHNNSPTGAPTGGVILGETFNLGYPTYPALPAGGGIVVPTKNFISNNLVVGSEGTLLYDKASTSTSWSGNYSYATSTASYGYTGTGVTTGTDPLLYSDTSGTTALYRLASNSPVIGKGDASFVTAEDMDGQARTLTAPDVGADQYSVSTITRRPLLATDVGPAWIGRSTTLPDSTIVWGY